MDKVLFIEWDSFGNEFIIKALKKVGFTPVKLPFDIKDDIRIGEELTVKIAEKALSENPVFIFSFNYYPVIAVAAKACRIPYVSWIYDSPLIHVYSKTINYETNYIFLFDKGIYYDLCKKGAERIFYLPMAADTEFYDSKCLGEEQRLKYSADMSFVGQLYTETKQNMFRHLEKADDYIKGYLDAIMDAQMGIYGISFLEKAITPDVLQRMQKICPVFARHDGIETAEWVFANYFLARKITSKERPALIRRLANESGADTFALYTPDNKTIIPNVQNRGKIDYYNDTPFVFKASKINLNISLRSILSGIPLRAFDIMGCGGFLLTNYQEDFLEFFTPDEDFVYYESQDDAVAKAKYYLKHDTERAQIAANAYGKVKDGHTYEHRVAEMISIIGG